MNGKRWITIVVSVASLAACEREHNPIGASALAAARTEAVVLSVQGPPSIAPGGSGRFRAMVTVDGGSPQDVTSTASWISSDVELLTTTAPGEYVAASKRGETTIVTTYRGYEVSTHVYVLEDGTFALHGRVLDGSFPAPGARVQVTNGTGAGSSAIARSDGSYALYGLSGSVRVVATLDGYLPTVELVTVSDDSLTVDFPLSLAAARPDIGGTWRMSFDASPSCGNLPDAARHRSYVLGIAARGSALDITFNMPLSAWPNGTSSFPTTGTLLGTTVRFVLPDDSVDGPWVYEHLEAGSSTLFMLGGAAIGSAGSGVIAGTVDATISLNAPGGGRVTCTAGDHRFMLER